jgi:SAM-dependent methyltransferase
LPGPRTIAGRSNRPDASGHLIQLFLGQDGWVLYEDRRRASSFGDDAEQYDRVRPTYPAELVDDLLSDGARDVLDVGSGTGIVSRLFAARGVEVLGIEPDPRMARVARSHGLRVEEASLEDWDPGSRLFDLVVSGQAWHWVDPVIGAAKVTSVLRPGGRVGLFWNHGALPPSIRSVVADIYSRYAPSLATQSIAIGNDISGRITGATEALRATGRLDPVTVTSYRHDAVYTTEAWIEDLASHSDHRTLDPGHLRPILDAIGTEIDARGGRFVMEYTTWLVSGRTAIEPTT